MYGPLWRALPGPWPVKLLHTLPRIGYRLGEPLGGDDG